MKSNFFYVLTLFIFLGLSACSSRTALAQRNTQVRVVYVKKTPPQPKFEVYKRCNRYHIWVKGHWQWNGHFYIWKKGHCVKKKRGFIWVPGHWKHTPRGWKWMQGHWR